ncbi:class IIb bacteriocin, lactobin A/cerein 7B family [Riemerella anatipestifer]|uniref:class IIb bacteriocin, lactobin A/cerein 7B family n=1 Tax=Riemerella anatipestifer TaxID=34085 RepID=UPI00236354C8|nr:class IIb bacteriocin, lactobin A/cerein 7B family [Riemerella anatipestifer]MDD1539443.1 class IIb bacteriocin, lactobin A/cerein 7B family [Riemerella anatipestifer]
MKLKNLTQKEMKNINGGWWKLVAGVFIEMVRDAIDNPDDFKAGFNAVRNR